MGHQPWKFESGQDPAGAQNNSFNDASWQSVGLPTSADELFTFTNETSGGGAGDSNGNPAWYRQHFTVGTQYSNRKVQVVFGGVNTGAQVYINGNLIPGTQAFAPQATHVEGFLPFICDLTPYINFGGDNVIAVRAARNANWFPDIGFAGGFRFDMGDLGIFRNVMMYITDKIYIPENVYSGSKLWGTYLATDAASDDSATIHIQTNVMNESGTPQDVTLTTQIVDANGNVVATRQDDQIITASTHANPLPVMFDQVLTVNKPTLWYPNNSIYGGPYLYKVFHTVSMNGVVIDSKQSMLGIRTVMWDQNFVYVNGKVQKLNGAGARYNYPGVESSMSEEQKWRDLQQFAAMGGNLWRPGHASEGDEFINAADALGVMLVDPSGDGENGFSDPCGPTAKMTCDQEALKLELHRDMIIRDRSHASVLAYEADNGVTLPAFAQQVAAVGKQWDFLGSDGPIGGPFGGRPQSDRSGGDPQYENNGDFLSCSGEGCEIGVKQSVPGKPVWGAEEWGPGSLSYDHDHEISMAAKYIDSWSKGLDSKIMGFAQWYFADSTGEEGQYVEPDIDANHNIERGIGDSMVDFERHPRLLYYIEKANWRPFRDAAGKIYKPVVKLANTWNRTGTIQVNAWSNCPSVRLLINGVQQGQDQIPNPSSSRADNDSDFVATELTTKLAAQAHWTVNWQSGTAVAACMDESGAVVNDPVTGTPVTDTLTTAGTPYQIVLEPVPNVTRPDGTTFQVTANGSDFELINAKVVDENGILVPDATNLLTFSVSGNATYVGGTVQLVDPTQPHSYHAPGDPNLPAEGGLQTILVKSQFNPGAVTVTATSPNLKSATASFNIFPIPQQTPSATAPAIIAEPVNTSVTRGFSAHFSVTATGAGPLQYQWFKGGVQIPSAMGTTFDTPPTTDGDDQAVYSVTVSNSLGSAPSTNAVLTVVAPAAPVITTQPLSQAIDAGGSVTFSVVATGSPTLSYQWTDNTVPIPGAITSTYTLQTSDTTENGHVFAVLIKNPVTTIQSNPAILTVNPARPPVVTTDPANVVALPGQIASFTVVATGSQPLTYVWTNQNTGLKVGGNSPILTIESVSNSSLGSYIVTVSNSAGMAQSKAATLSLAPPGVNMSLGKTASASSFEDPVGLAAKFGIDGDTTTRWGSNFSNPATAVPQFFVIDYGVSMTFNRSKITWDSSFATAYDMEVSSDGTDWGAPFHVQTAGTGQVEDFTFPTQTARYLRLFATERNDQYGISIHELATYNGAACGDRKEHWTLNPSVSTLVLDNLSGLTWKNTPKTTDNSADGQFTQVSAINYCQTLGMRIPTKDEALAISGSSGPSCAFPTFWATWTSTDDPVDATRAVIIDSTGGVSAGIKDNSPGSTLCVLGDVQTVPVITTQPAPTTVEANQAATFSVAATTSGNALATYTWLKNGVAFQVTGVPTVTTPLITADDNNALYSVTVTGGNGLTATSNTALLTVNGTAPPPTGGGGGGTGGGTAPPPPCGNATACTGNGNGPAPVGPNLALNKTATSSADESGSFPAKNGVDGNFNTRWSSAFFDTESYEVDLGLVQPIGQALIRWQDSYGKSYVIETSSDENTWTTAFTQNNGLGGVDNLTFPTVNARYIRMRGLTRATHYGYSFWEFEVYGPVLPTIITQPVSQSVVVGATAQFTVVTDGKVPCTYQWFRDGVIIPGATSATYTTLALALADTNSSFSVIVSNGSASVPSSSALLTVTDPVTPTVGIANLALGKPVTSSSNENNNLGPLNAVDGDLTTRWSSGHTDTEWLEVDLGSPMLTSKVMIYWEAAYGKAYEIQVSNDEQAWTTVAKQNEGKGGVETVPLLSTVNRYIRFFGLTRATTYGYSFYEFQVYGADVPVISTQPTSQTVISGKSATFTAAATGTGLISLQWNRNGVPISGATGTSYTTPIATSQDNSSIFTLVATNASGASTSLGAKLTVNSPAPTGPNLALNQPATSSADENAQLGPANAVDGDTTTRWSSAFFDKEWLQIDLGSLKTIAQVVIDWQNSFGKAYQIQVSTDLQTWTTVYTQSNGNGGTENITFPSANGRYVRMLGVTRSSPYGYSIYEFQVYGVGGTNVGSAPTITTEPANQTANVGSTATFSVVAAGTGPFTYQWLKGTTPITGATAASYTTPLLAATDNSNLYSVVVSNANGTITSNPPATLTVNNVGNAPTISTEPANQTATVGGTATFTVVAAGTGPFTYQWLKGTTPITGATAASYTTPVLAASDNGNQYSVIVGNANGTITSNPPATLTVNTGPNYPIFPGFVGVDLQNNTKGTWTDGQIFVTVIGRDAANNNAFAYLTSDGTVIDFTLNDGADPNHLTKNGKNYGNYSFSLAQTKLLKIPTLVSARAFISLGEPLYIQINPDPNNPTQVVGYAGPSRTNATDPNFNTPLDWYEFDNETLMDINTTQVDRFGLPLTLDVWSAGGTSHQRIGITESIAQLDAEFATEVPAEFQPPTMNNLNILSPASLGMPMAADGANAHYFDNVIATAWKSYATSPITITVSGRQFKGTAVASTLTFTEVNPSASHAGETFVVQQPSTQEVFLCNGSMNEGVDMSNGSTPALQDEDAVQRQLQNQVCSATNRGVLSNPANWANASTYYSTSPAPANYYSAFWHRHSIDGLAYGFAYDDNNNQSGSINVKAEHMVFGIGW
ncbi:discoidin domain-containing protein [Terriglobus saanensis]|nr:discoidin domain-containing protein [Terriglobus saanensis]